MGFFKKQLLEVIEWNDNSKDTIVYRYPLTTREEIMNSSTLVVRPSQTAVFVHKGQIADVFAPGTYKLATENIPFLTKLLSLPTGFNSTIKAEIYFVNTKQFNGLRWGTQNPIMMRDKDFGNVRLRGFGTYSFKIVDVKTFMQEVFGTNALYTVTDITNHNRPLLIQGVTDAIGESKISALDLAASYKEFANQIKELTNPEFLKLGMKLTSVIVENISLPEEVEKYLDQRTKLGMMEDKIDTYTRLKAADALGDAAKNEGNGGLAGLGIGLGTGTALGQMFAQNLATTPGRKVVPSQTENGKVCTCGVVNPMKAKFCTECGTKLATKAYCSHCGAEVKTNAKFCSECGTKLGG